MISQYILKIALTLLLYYYNYNLSPMFIQDGPHGTAILYVPSVFISYNGEALDEKSVLLRSSEVLNKTVLEYLSMIEEVDEGKINKKRINNEKKI